MNKLVFAAMIATLLLIGAQPAAAYYDSASGTLYAGRLTDDYFIYALWDPSGGYVSSSHSVSWTSQLDLNDIAEVEHHVYDTANGVYPVDYIWTDSKFLPPWSGSWSTGGSTSIPNPSTTWQRARVVLAEIDDPWTVIGAAVEHNFYG